MVITKYTFAQAYEKMLKDLLFYPQFVTAPRGQSIHEVINAKIIIANPYQNLFLNKIRSVPEKYLANELLLYFGGLNDAKSFGKASPFWLNIKNDDDTVNSAYGRILFGQSLNNSQHFSSQWEYAKYSLIKDKDSRQAIMHYNTPVHQRDGIKDFPCTICSQFFIRNDELFLTTYMRSNDIFFGVTFDFPFFMLLMQCMLLELEEIYPKLRMGTYTHFAGSLHAYERDFDILMDMSKNKFETDCLPMLEENPIYHPDIYRMLEDKEPKTDDYFLEWLYKNK